MSRVLGMEFDIWHSRCIQPGELQTSPGGYEIMLDDGRKYQFDFTESEGWVDESDRHIAHYIVKGLDTGVFPESTALTSELLTQNHYVFLDFYIDLEGYDGAPLYAEPLIETVEFIFE